MPFEKAIEQQDTAFFYNIQQKGALLNFYNTNNLFKTFIKISVNVKCELLMSYLIDLNRNLKASIL